MEAKKHGPQENNTNDSQDSQMELITGSHGSIDFIDAKKLQDWAKEIQRFVELTRKSCIQGEARDE